MSSNNPLLPPELLYGIVFAAIVSAKRIFKLPGILKQRLIGGYSLVIHG